MSSESKVLLSLPNATLGTVIDNTHRIKDTMIFSIDQITYDVLKVPFLKKNTEKLDLFLV